MYTPEGLNADRFPSHALSRLLLLLHQLTSQAFDDLLDRTVRAPRLSGTKVGELRDMAKQLAPQHGADIVDILTKTNASLKPASTSRISSLYVFDAIARAAKSDAALLGKMEAAVGGFVDSIIDNGKGGVWSEGRVSRAGAPPTV